MRKIIVLFLVLISTHVTAEVLDKVVAIVNDNVITETELSLEIETMRQQILSKNMAVPAENILRKQVLQHLIDVDLQLQLAKNNNISIDTTELDASIAKIAENNKLSLTQLREELAKQGIAWESYRENIRKEMLLNRIQQRSVAKDVVVSGQQVDDYLKTAKNSEKAQQLFHVQNIVVPLADAPTTEQLNKATARAQDLLHKIKSGEDFNHVASTEYKDGYALEGADLGERHLAELPEIFASHVVDMKVGDVAGPIRTGNGIHLIKLISINESHEHHEVTKTHVRHILIKQAANMTLAEAETQVKNLYQQLKSGKDFASMAKKYSLDSASAVNGGDLGWVVSEELVLAFADAMNALPLHTISQPVQSPFGWHLIEVLERKVEDDSEMFKRQQVRQFLHERKFTEAVVSWQQHIRTDAYINIVEKDLA